MFCAGNSLAFSDILYIAKLISCHQIDKHYFNKPNLPAINIRFLCQLVRADILFLRVKPSLAPLHMCL